MNQEELDDMRRRESDELKKWNSNLGQPSTNLWTKFDKDDWDEVMANLDETRESVDDDEDEEEDNYYPRTHVTGIDPMVEQSRVRQFTFAEDEDEVWTRDVSGLSDGELSEYGIHRQAGVRSEGSDQIVDVGTDHDWIQIMEESLRKKDKLDTEGGETDGE